MSDAHHRKKQPAVTRRQLLDVAATLALESGMGGLTLDAVARAAGVSKGGLLHHFPSKQALFEGLFDSLVERFQEEIDREAARDAEVAGRTARAYLRAVTGLRGGGESRLWGIMSAAMLFEPSLRERWRSWLVEHMRRDAADPAGEASLAVARLAADGLWFADLFGTFDDSPELRAEIVERLESMTRDPRPGGAG